MKIPISFRIRHSAIFSWSQWWLCERLRAFLKAYPYPGDMFYARMGFIHSAQNVKSNTSIEMAHWDTSTGSMANLDAMFGDPGYTTTPKWHGGDLIVPVIVRSSLNWAMTDTNKFPSRHLWHHRELWTFSRSPLNIYRFAIGQVHISQRALLKYALLVIFYEEWIKLIRLTSFGSTVDQKRPNYSYVYRFILKCNEDGTFQSSWHTKITHWLQEFSKSS